MHDLRFQADNFAALTDMMGRATALGAAFDTVRAERAGDAIVMRCRLKGISSEAARALANALEGAGCAAAQIEHVMIARKV